MNKMHVSKLCLDCIWCIRVCGALLWYVNDVCTCVYTRKCTRTCVLCMCVFVVYGVLVHDHSYSNRIT